MLDAFLKALAGPCSVRQGTAVLVCVSGGLDSMVLLELMRQAARPMQLRIGVVHVDHGIRREASAGDAEFVLKRCRELSIPSFLKELHMDPDVPNLEEEARHRRYRVIIECKNEEGFNFAATGHTLNDQAETILYRIIRGTGIRGLAGISWCRPDGIIRPMLNLTRNRLQEFARKNGIGYVLDKTNEDQKHTRNLIRHSMIPVMERINPRAVEAVARLADIARDEGGLLEETAAGMEAQARLFDWVIAKGFSLDTLRKNHETAVRRFIINTVTDMTGEPRGIDLIQVDAVLDVIRGKAAAHTVKRKVKVSVEGDVLMFSTASKGPHYRIPVRGEELPIPEIAQTIHLSWFPGKSAYVRSFLPGDRIGKKRVAEILADMGIISVLRQFWPVLVVGKRVLSVASKEKEFFLGEVREPDHHGK